MVVVVAGCAALREAWVLHGPSAAPQMRVEQSSLSKWGELGLCVSHCILKRWPFCESQCARALRLKCS